MGEQLREWAELHAHYSPDASCSSRLRFWLWLACVFICVAWRVMRSWKYAYSSSGQTAGSILRTHLQVCGVPEVRPPSLLVELVESHFRDGIAGNVRSLALHQPRDLRRPNCLVDVVLLVRGHTCVGNTGGERGWPTTPCLTSTNRFAVSDIGGACFQKAATAMKVKISTSGPETTAAAEGLVRKRAAPSCSWTELPAPAKAEPACFACFFLPLTAAPPRRLPAYMTS